MVGKGAGRPQLSKTYLKLGCLPGVNGSGRPYLVVHKGVECCPLGAKGRRRSATWQGAILGAKVFGGFSGVVRGAPHRGSAGSLLRHGILCVDTVVPRV